MTNQAHFLYETTEGKPWSIAKSLDIKQDACLRLLWILPKADLPAVTSWRTQGEA